MVRAIGPLPDRLAALGALVAGLAWSAGVAAAHWREIEGAGLSLASSLALVALGGLGAALAVWCGVGAVAWAMIRLLGGKAGFGRVLLAVSAAAVPIWAAAPIGAFLAAGQGGATTGLLAAAIAFAAAVAVAQAAAALRALADFTPARAWACIGLTGTFCASLISLQA